MREILIRKSSWLSARLRARGSPRFLSSRSSPWLMIFKKKFPERNSFEYRLFFIDRLYYISWKSNRTERKTVFVGSILAIESKKDSKGKREILSVVEKHSYPIKRRLFAKGERLAGNVGFPFAKETLYVARTIEFCRVQSR